MILTGLAEEEGLGRDKHLKLKAAEMGCHRMERGVIEKCIGLGSHVLKA